MIIAIICIYINIIIDIIYIYIYMIVDIICIYIYYYRHNIYIYICDYLHNMYTNIYIYIYIYILHVCWTTQISWSPDLTSKVEVTAASASAAPPWYRQRHGAPGRGEHVGDFTGIGWIFQENMVKKWNFQGKIGVMGNMRAFGVLWDIKSLNNEETWHFQSGQMMTNVCFQTGTLKQEIYMVTPANMLISFWKMRNLYILATGTGSFF